MGCSIEPWIARVKIFPEMEKNPGLTGFGR
jgi:hypothetical protein